MGIVTRVELHNIDYNSTANILHLTTTLLDSNIDQPHNQYYKYSAKMEAIYSTEKLPGQTLAEFTADVHANLDAWIDRMWSRNETQSHVTSQMSSSLLRVQHCISSEEANLQELVKYESGPNKRCAEDTLEYLTAKKQCLTSTRMNRGLISYEGYAKTLEEVKRVRMYKAAGVISGPRIVRFPCITKEGFNHTGDDDCVFYCYPDLRCKLTKPYSILAYKAMLKEDYTLLLQQNGEKVNYLITQEQFEIELEKTMASLVEFDILVVPYPLFVCKIDGVLCVKQLRDVQGDSVLPKDAYPMLKKFNIKTHEDLLALYPYSGEPTFGEPDPIILGVESPNGNDVIVFACRERASRSREVKLDDHIIFASSVQSFPRNVQ